jgi:hypothetical protein
MHWFWRATIAVVAVTGAMILLHPLLISSVFLDDFVLPIYKLVGQPIGSSILYFFPISVVAITIYGLLTRYFHPRKSFLDGETRCRKCGYILRGITEPRCSECGEKI